MRLASPDFNAWAAVAFGIISVPVLLTMQRFMFGGQYDFMHSHLVSLDTHSGEK